MDLPSDVFLALEEGAKETVDAEQEEARESEETGEPEPGESPEPSEPNVQEDTEWVYRQLETMTGEDHDTFWERNFEQIEGCRSPVQLFRCLESSFGKQHGIILCAPPRRWCGKPI